LFIHISTANHRIKKGESKQENKDGWRMHPFSQQYFDGFCTGIPLYSQLLCC
jgi:hypothetical protein